MGILIGLLKIIGIILALILIIVCIIIFSSINLKVMFDNREKITYFLKVTYLLGIVTYILDSKNNINYLKIFGINIEKFKKNKNIQEDEKTENKKIKDEKIENQQETKEKGYTISSINLDDNKEIKINYTQDSIYDKKENTIKKWQNKLISLKNKIKQVKYKIIEIIEKIKFILSYPDKKEILNISFLLLKRLIKAIKFKKISINIDYGLDEPFKTGNVCGIISAIMPFLPKKHLKNINIMPDFENQLFLANLEIKCKTSLFKILLPIITFITKKPIRKIIFSKGE